MNQKIDIEEIKEELQGKLEIALKEDPNLIEPEGIRINKIAKIYKNFLKEKSPKNWKKLDLIIGLKESTLVFDIMEDLEYYYDYVEQGVNGYFQKIQKTE